jgi:GTP cyclohydrolase I
MSYKKVEEYCDDELEKMAKNNKEILKLIGEDPDREGLVKTPMRIAKAVQFMTQGYKMSAKKIIESARFKESVSEMVIVKDIELYSMCEHHMLPFFGKAHIAYIPNGILSVLAKLPG